MLSVLGERGTSLHALTVGGGGPLGEGCGWSREPWSGAWAWAMGQAGGATAEAIVAAACLGFQPTPLGSI